MVDDQKETESDLLWNNIGFHRPVGGFFFDLPFRLAQLIIGIALVSFLPKSHPWFEGLKGTDGAVEVLWRIRHLYQLQNPTESSLIGYHLSWKKEIKLRQFNPLNNPMAYGRRNEQGHGEWSNFGDNVAFAHYILKFSGRKYLLEGYIFSRSDQDSPEFKPIGHCL